MPQARVRHQLQLFEEPLAAPVIRLPLNVQEQLRQALVQWMQALGRMIRVEDDDEQHHR